MDSARKKELMNAYKSRTVVGGICCIRCSGNGREFIQATTDIEGLRHRFDFALTMKSAPDPSMQKECAKYGADSFSFSVLEEMKKGEDQTDDEFSNDIDALYDMWIENHKDTQQAEGSK